MAKTKQVAIVLRDGWAIATPTVEVLWECPTCGEDMGDSIHGHNFVEDGDSHWCQKWTTPCGHVAKYDHVKMKQDDGNFKSWAEILAERKGGAHV